MPKVSARAAWPLKRALQTGSQCCQQSTAPTAVNSCIQEPKLQPACTADKCQAATPQQHLLLLLCLLQVRQQLQGRQTQQQQHASCRVHEEGQSIPMLARSNGHSPCS